MQFYNSNEINKTRYWNELTAKSNKINMIARPYINSQCISDQFLKANILFLKQYLVFVSISISFLFGILNFINFSLINAQAFTFMCCSIGASNYSGILESANFILAQNI